MITKLLADLRHRHHQFAIRRGEALVRSLEANIARHSLVANRPFLATSSFPWIAEVEAHWPVIRQELDSLLQLVESLPNFQDISADQYSITDDNLWKTFFLYGYGFKAEKNCLRCPQTTRLIEQIPGMKTAFFSILLPHKHIPEHRGPYKGVLRYHLGLRIPQPLGDRPEDVCRIRVGDETHAWQEGKSLVFDDTFPHEAWNPTNDIRVVLFVDVVRPMRQPFSLLNRAMIWLIGISPYIQEAKRQTLAWEDRLEQVAPVGPPVPVKGHVKGA
ncbi:aspartyl/asparaginyl beta-hydroxylase domain-containing protein [Okeania sp. SIO2G5]|uniref:aspartyl/asparaginyl beta-hydroxylase domain-containing protein n=1 Tax=Okeania sp. SIO2G5 TaxID=2607796 RepID=UPI0013BEBDDD|nr:aspartyl/asparaginyl beta-hydroxylase domain-containing protein [Okeania sp. SIO2G5]NEP76254.1 aspartyl/asparaginyl beta-hydroxylase domain-containing protein [Okeania sp. SIO2G5]